MPSWKRVALSPVWGGGSPGSENVMMFFVRKLCAGDAGFNPFGTAVPYWGKLLEIRVACPRNGIAVLKRSSVSC